MGQGKKWYESKTIRVNGIITVLTILLFVLQGLSNGDLQLPIEPDAALVAMLVSLLNAILRFVTHQPITK